MARPKLTLRDPRDRTICFQLGEGHVGKLDTLVAELGFPGRSAFLSWLFQAVLNSLWNLQSGDEDAGRHELQDRLSMFRHQITKELLFSHLVTSRAQGYLVDLFEIDQDYFEDLKDQWNCLAEAAFLDSLDQRSAEMEMHSIIKGDENEG
jgi:hypothetical protein